MTILKEDAWIKRAKKLKTILISDCKHITYTFGSDKTISTYMIEEIENKPKHKTVVICTT